MQPDSPAVEYVAGCQPGTWVQSTGRQRMGSSSLDLLEPMHCKVSDCSQTDCSCGTVLDTKPQAGCSTEPGEGLAPLQCTSESSATV